ncbi:ribonuclease HII [Gammaproteobacteria bacterium]|nr:ribonuclease HII [Gammaproteobacteria bacterium]
MLRRSLKLVGVDEAGRGPLAGPVVAGAVSLRYAEPGLMDSKKLSEKKREALFEVITQNHDWSFSVVTSREIDEYNIHQASLLAFQRAVSALNADIEQVLVDGVHLPNWSYQSSAIIKGDEKIAAISAASIIAKVVRDRMMVGLDTLYPHYGFAKHKGYPTKAHLAALDQHGPILSHRVSYQPVKKRVRT